MTVIEAHSGNRGLASSNPPKLVQFLVEGFQEVPLHSTHSLRYFIPTFRFNSGVQHSLAGDYALITSIFEYTFVKTGDWRRSPSSCLLGETAELIFALDG